VGPRITAGRRFEQRDNPGAVVDLKATMRAMWP